MSNIRAELSGFLLKLTLQKDLNYNLMGI